MTDVTDAPNAAANTDPPDTHCSICRAPLRPWGRWGVCDHSTGCGLLSTHYGDRRPTRWAMWVRWCAYRVVVVVLGNEWSNR